MIGIVVVTHGQVAEELVNAARTIVGDIPAIVAVSIGWGDDPAAANAAIEKGLEDVGGGEALILTDMFGGTPTNLSLPHLSSQVEIVTGVNLPMIIKATALRDGVLPHVAHQIRDQGKDSIYVASEVLEKAEVVTRRQVTIQNSLGLHARAAARFVHTAAQFKARVTAGRDGRVMDGKSILGILLLGASRGTTVEITAEGEDEEEAVEALVALVEGRFGEEGVITLRGTAVSPGIAVGPALVVERDAVPVFRLSLAPDAVEPEVGRLEVALEASRDQLRAVKERMQKEVGTPHAYIFDAHLLMLDDPLLRARAVEIVRAEAVNAEWALRTVSEELHELFDHFSDAYLRERSTDLDDVIGRVHLNLRGAPGAPTLERLPGPVVLVAGDLSPSEAAELDWDKVLAVATDVGSSTYHTAIIARSMGIPAVVGLKDATKRTPSGSVVVVDGSRGEVLVDPSEAVLESIRRVQEEYRIEDDRLRATRELPARTADGVDVLLEANVEFLDEAATAQLYGANGIGLFRSEYLLGRGAEWPTEEQQLDVYRRLIEQMHPHPVTVRTWDIGLDVLVPLGPSSPNPALGERALRLLPRSREPFRVQLRALLRAGEYGPIRIMFPFVGGVGDLQVALSLLDETRAGLRHEGIRFREDVPVGINLEVPSAAVVADLLAPEVDFFSVGTNDLIQYLLAVDRTDPRVSGLYEPLHPAVLRTLAHIAAAARSQDRPVAVCGEMAGQPLEAVLLVGLGFRELSMAPSAIPRVKEALRAVREQDARRIVEHCLSLRTCAEIVAFVRAELPAAAADGAIQPAR